MPVCPTRAPVNPAFKIRIHDLKGTSINQASHNTGNQLHAPQREQSEDNCCEGLACSQCETGRNTQRGEQTRKCKDRCDEVVRIVKGEATSGKNRPRADESQCNQQHWLAAAALRASP